MKITLDIKPANENNFIDSMIEDHCPSDFGLKQKSCEEMNEDCYECWTYSFHNPKEDQGENPYMEFIS